MLPPQSLNAWASSVIAELLATFFESEKNADEIEEEEEERTHQAHHEVHWVKRIHKIIYSQSSRMQEHVIRIILEWGQC